MLLVLASVVSLLCSSNPLPLLPCENTHSVTITEVTNAGRQAVTTDDLMSHLTQSLIASPAVATAPVGGMCACATCVCVWVGGCVCVGLCVCARV